MNIGTWILMTLGFIVAGLAGLRLRERVLDRRLTKQYPERKT